MKTAELIKQIKEKSATDKTTFTLDMPEHGVVAKVYGPNEWGEIYCWIEVGYHTEDHYYKKPGYVAQMVGRNLSKEAYRDVDWVRSDADEV